jgi:hypothetical protein
VIVNLKSGKALAGVLTAQRGPLVELRNAELYEAPGRPPVPLDGAVVLERAEIEFVQVLGDREV